MFKTFADLTKHPPSERPTSIFMAGSPGAGKTEFSKNFNEEVVAKLKAPSNAVRIDADEIREIIPIYTGKNSDIVQSAAFLGVEKLHDYALKNNQNLILDGTFANYEVSCHNIERAIKRSRLVGIFYIYQDPVIAWEFTKKRGKIEGRVVPKEVFIKALFAAKDNVNRAKSMFGDKIRLSLIEKNYQNDIEKIRFNIESVDNYIKISYDKLSLTKLLEE